MLFRSEEGALGALLFKKGLSLDDVMDQVVTYEVNMDKVQGLVASGDLTPMEVDDCRKVTSTQLKVEKI